MRTIDTHDIDLWRRAVMNESDITHIDNAVTGRFDRQPVELVDRSRRIVHGDDVLEPADFLCSHRDDEILCGKRVDHVLSGKSVGLQLLLVDIDLHLTDLPAEGDGMAAPATVASCGLMKFCA